MDNNTIKNDALSAQDEKNIDRILQTCAAPQAHKNLSQRIIAEAKNTPHHSHAHTHKSSANWNNPSLVMQMGEWFKALFPQSYGAPQIALALGAVMILCVGVGIAIMPQHNTAQTLSVSDIDAQTAALMIETELFFDMASLD